MALADTVKQRTGLSGRKLKSFGTHAAGSADWLRTHPYKAKTGVSMAAQTYVNGRYLEVQVYDFDAPEWRRWNITLTDRETGSHVTLVGAAQRETTAAALKQIGALDR